MEISPQQWSRVKDLYEAALECTPALRDDYLRHNEDDERVREEVLRLLAQGEQLGSFLSNSPWLKKSSSLAFPQRLRIGEILTERFRVIRFIAAGGMGEVYEAEDLELRENVAIKTFRAHIIVQKDSLSRFKREVQLARKVTHPNVCRIFDLFRHKPQNGNAEEEIVFVAMELLRGKTLQEHIQELGRMSPEDALRLIRPMASALAAAHAAGIVHRDFKPGNVILVAANEGTLRPVVTDFGLAFESLVPDADARSSVGHGQWGTPAYMSPEQLEGRVATARSDIYALGVVIYEMVTGRKLFNGETPLSEVLTPPRETSLPRPEFNSHLSTAWVSAIQRCLQRDPTQRFEGAESVAEALAPGPHSQSNIPSRKRFISRPALAITVVMVAAWTFILYKPRKQSTTPKQQVTLRQLTQSSGDNDFIGRALISPDGKNVVYLQSSGALLLSSIETGETRVLKSVAGHIFFPESWFPDGNELLMLRQDRSLWRMSTLTGQMSKVRDKVGGAAAAPDGRHILYRDSADREFWLMEPNGEGAHRVLAAPTGNTLLAFSWSGNGQRFAYMISGQGSNDARIESVDIEGKQQPMPIVSHVTLPESRWQALCWLPDGRLIYLVGQGWGKQQNSNLSTIDVDPTNGHVGRGPDQLTNWAVLDTGDISASADGKRLLFITYRDQVGIYIAPLRAGRKVGLGNPRLLVTDSWADMVDAWSMDGKTVYLSSNRRGSFEIYRQKINEQVSELLISGKENYGDAHLSADGRFLFYTAVPKVKSADAEMHLMSIPVGGGIPSIVATGHYDHQCAQAPASICILSETTGTREDFYFFDLSHGRAAQPFKSIGGDVLSWSLSHDGHKIAFILSKQTQSPIPEDHLQILSLSNNQMRTLPLPKWSQNHLEQGLSWSADDKALYLVSYVPSTSGDRLFSVNLDGTTTTLFDGQKSLCCTKPAPHGRFLAFSTLHLQRDIVMAENF